MPRRLLAVLPRFRCGRRNPAEIQRNFSAVAVAVADAATGEILESSNPALVLPPASVTKAVTAVYALETLGGAHRFTTRIVATGPVVDGKVQGDLVLEGGGDPGLDTDALGDMARQLKAAGVSGVTGGFKVCSTCLLYTSPSPRDS